MTSDRLTEKILQSLIAHFEAEMEWTVYHEDDGSVWAFNYGDIFGADLNLSAMAERVNRDLTPNPDKIDSQDPLVQRAYEVIGDKALADRWMVTEVPALEDRRPVDLVWTSDGREAIQDALTQIENGVW